MRHRISSALLLLIVLSLLQLTPSRAADMPMDDAAKLTQILGASDKWKLTPATGYVLGTKAGVPTLTGPASTVLTVESSDVVAAPVELEVKYRLIAPKGLSTYVQLQLAVGEHQDKKPQSIDLSVSSTDATNYLRYTTTVKGGTVGPAASGYLHFAAVSERSLGWTEEMRRAIDAQIAASPKIEESLLTAKLSIANGRVRSWVNGRFVSETKLASDYNATGKVRILAASGCELVSVQVRPLAAQPTLFEPISIEGHTNSDTLNGSKVDLSSLTGDQQVDGVPFQFVPPANSRGDHLDVGQSWTRFGSIPGYIAGNFGSFGGRWISADRIDPSRLCFYVPQGRYKALHLIAVADDRQDGVPVVGVQFYRPNAGHPMNFSGTVPNNKGKGGEGKAVPIKLANGKSAKLYHVTIPLDPDAFSWLSDLDLIGLEITKQIHYYRGYPDPLEYSWHGGGLPSSVQIYAMTLERAGVDIDIVPENFGHVWTAPSMPKYSIDLRNDTGKTTKAKLVIATTSEDGKDTSRKEVNVTLPADGTLVKTPITLNPTRYGLHRLTVTVKAGDENASYERNLAFFHEDTRDKEPWQHGHGPILGYWGWGGAHDTPKADKEISVMAAAGAETSTANYELGTPEVQAMAEKHNFVSEAAFFGGVMYYNGFYDWYSGAPKFNPADPEGSGKALVEAMKKGGKAQPSKISRPTYVPFFAEPHFGNITTGIWPSYYGEPYTLTEAEQKIFDDMKVKFLAGAKAIRKEWPDLKLLLPYGDPMVAAVFLRLAPETREYIDGCALDLPGFERLPEQQINQVVLNRLYPILKDIRQYVKDPYFTLIEGTCISSKDFDTGERGQAEIGIRDFLVLMGYGINNLESGNAPFDCANYWGENHYGAGWLTRLPLAMPKPGYVQYATMTRHLNRANFVKYVPTGSTSTYCQRYDHYKTGKVIHVLWTIRGTRPVSIHVPSGTTIDVYDPNDNVTTLREKNGVVTFNIDQLPVYVEGLTGDAKITLGKSDHSDSKPGKESEKLANLGDGSWTIVKKSDAEYTGNKPLQVERFLADMTGTSVEAPKAQGRRALAVHLEPQDKDRGVMPFYTTIEPTKPIAIPGKASRLGLWVHASSDWGRVVYVVRDAKGEKWLSVGTKDDWNNDDIHGWSNFCFDGWRYLTFQLPSNLPYDSYRERGSSWWGHYGGDGIVDLPLSIEKLIVERRPKAIYGNDLVEVSKDDVLLGDLRAEYASEDDKGEEVIRLSRLRMPPPASAPDLTNPIAELAATGTGTPTTIKGVRDPEHFYDGTRCHVDFDPVAGAKTYDVWVSPYEDGRGALKLGAAWTEPGKLIQGLRPEITFFAFVTYTDAQGKVSKPSTPLRFVLKDRFGYK